MQSKHKKLISLFSILFIIITFLPLYLTSAEYYGEHVINSYSSEQLDYVGIMANTWNTTTSNLIQSFGQSFVGTGNYLTGTGVYLKKVGGARTGFVTMAVVNATGTYGENDDLPLNMDLVLANALEISTTKVNIASVTTIGSMYRFNYTGTTFLKLGNNYTLFVFYENSTTASSDVNYVGVGLDITSSFASGRFSFKGGATGVWTIEASTKDMIYDVYGSIYYQGETPIATATPNPSAWGYWNGTAWVPNATETPFAQTSAYDFTIIAVPIIVIAICAGLGFLTMGMWGGWIGVNIAVILLYTLSSYLTISYMPLWGVILIAICDVGLLFGSGVLSRGKHD